MNKLFKSTANTVGIRAFSSSYLIKGGTVVNADRQFKADVAIQGDKVQGLYAPAENIGAQRNFDRVFDATGKFVMPGGIDPHVHMELPFMGTTSADDFDKGSRAAVAGGTTSFIDFIFAGEEGILAGYDDWRRRADPKVHCDYALHCGVTHWNDKISQQMEEIATKRGINSFKVFMAYKGTSFYQSDERLLQIMERAKELGCVVMVHAENGELIDYNQKRLVKAGVLGPEGHPLSRSDEIEGEATHRVITIANTVNVPLYIVHLMKRMANDEVVRAKRNGNVVFGEALAAGLGTDGRHYWDPDWDRAAGYVMSPAIDHNPQTKEY
jgi:dihydropyrimidinase